jgi:hypothetical protein
MFEEHNYPVKEDPEVVKSTEIFWCFIPHRYVIRHNPKFKALPYVACRENMKLVGEVWETDIFYWCSYGKEQADVEAEYQKKIASEGEKA